MTPTTGAYPAIGSRARLNHPLRHCGLRTGGFPLSGQSWDHPGLCGKFAYPEFMHMDISAW